MLARAVVSAAILFAGCSLIESFEGYSDDWGRDAGSADSSAAGGGAGTNGGSGGADATLECAAGRDACSGACVDLAADDDNCGSCGNGCEQEKGPLSACSSGVCVCASGAIECGGVCTRISSDPENCGGCGTSVDPAEYCVAGQPLCRPRTTLCETWYTTQGYEVSCDGYPKCTDMKWDGSHCVDTGGKSRCWTSSTSTGRCIDGSCEYDGACPAGRVECPSTLSNVKSCFDPKNDSNHCGGCSKQCTAGQTCANAQCVDYFVVTDCSECGSSAKCCPTPSGWAHSTICVAGSACPE